MNRLSISLFTFIVLIAHQPLYARLTNNNQSDSRKLFVTTIPKSGTHMLKKALTEITGGNFHWGDAVSTVEPHILDSLKENTFYMLHAPCTAYNYDMINYRKLKTILLIRDPRDVLVSWAHWLKESKGNKEFYEHMSLSQLISALIKNYCLSHECTQTLVDFYEQYLCWLSYPHAYVTTFEKLVGPLGKGNQTIQENEIMQIADFLNVPIDQSAARKICSHLFGGTVTFRVGRIGSWKEELSDQQKQALKALPGFNKLLIKLQYEKNEVW